MAKAKKKVSKKAAAKKKVAGRSIVAKKAAKKRIAKNKVVSRKVTKKKVVSRKVTKKKVAKRTAGKKKAVSRATARKTTKKKAPAKKKITKKRVAKKIVKKAAARATAKKAAAPKHKTAPATRKNPAKRARKKPLTAAAVAKPARKNTDNVVKSILRMRTVNLDDVKLPEGYVPASKEEYMSPRHLLYFRQKLERWREELIAESQETLDHLRSETRDVGDEAERASRESDNILELRTRDRYRKLLKKIDDAMKRIEDGSYGYCEETGEEIGLGRLEARPIATLTVDAQERRELFQRQFRDDR